MCSRSVHPASLDHDELLRQCDVRRVRRSGPGGQHRNKVETGIVLSHRPTGVMAEANERRSQAENQRVAVNRLRLNLAVAVRESVDGESPPSLLWRTRCRGGRIVVNPEHAEFPSLLAEALDRLAGENMDVKAAAARLGCTSSQLVKLLKVQPRAFAWVNSGREARGLLRLK